MNKFFSEESLILSIPFRSLLNKSSQHKNWLKWRQKKDFFSAFVEFWLTGIKLHISNSDDNSSEHFGSSFKYGGRGGGGIEKSGGGTNPHSMSQSNFKSISNFFHITIDFSEFIFHMNSTVDCFYSFVNSGKGEKNHKINSQFLTDFHWFLMVFCVEKDFTGTAFTGWKICCAIIFDIILKNFWYDLINFFPSLVELCQATQILNKKILSISKFFLFWQS